ncbi:hypothetical protein ACWEGQ_00225 [Streptomyces seoulensis]
MTDPTIETARALLYRHGLPEDVIDGALALHAQELAAAIREETRRLKAHGVLEPAKYRPCRDAANQIDPTRNEDDVDPDEVAVEQPPVDRAALRQRVADALYRREWPSKQIWEQALAMDREVFEGMADAVLAVLPEPADRAAVLREAADDFEQKHTVTRMWGHQVATLLRRMADEAQQGDLLVHRPQRGDEFEQWLKAQRDEHRDTGHGVWSTLDSLLDRYRLHADTGTPLGEHVCEGRVAGDCECLEQPAKPTRTPMDPVHILGIEAAEAAATETQADSTTLLELVKDFLDPDPCAFDHHGYCQAHGYLGGEPMSCPHGRARKLLSDLDESAAGARQDGAQQQGGGE